MIDKKDIDAYMSIKAPESIKERILSEQAKNNRRISSTVRMCYALAAMLLVIAAVFAFVPTTDTELLYNNKPLDKNAVMIMASNENARIASLSLDASEDVTNIPLTVKTDKKVNITVSHGSIILPDGNNSTELGKSVTLEGDTEFIWSLTLDSDTAVYTVKIGKVSYCISKNDDSEWELSKK